MPSDFDDLYRIHLTAVWRYVRARVPEHHEAQDVTSEIFTRAWRSWDRYDPLKGSARAWLFRIAQFAVADWWRKRRPSGTASDYILLAEEGALPEESLLQEELLHQLQQALARLSDREREALALRFSGGLTSAEIGQILSMEESATKVMIYRAVIKLKGVMARDGAGL